ncbi:hypothetical protein PVK06_047212 [Gossypium arboreum]|uniref:Uncharacterized protein n=1 Tax=Gossypium arboreum TaxID=29729 RepID=A0ABR0MCU7_GOSAR|nr:hypothetical protein PVK06_047212 [Gossypium arboreum]
MMLIKLHDYDYIDEETELNHPPAFLHHLLGQVFIPLIHVLDLMEDGKLKKLVTVDANAGLFVWTSQSRNSSTCGTADSLNAKKP